MICDRDLCLETQGRSSIHSIAQYLHAYVHSPVQQCINSLSRHSMLTSPLFLGKSTISSINFTSPLPLRMMPMVKGLTERSPSGHTICQPHSVHIRGYCTAIFRIMAFNLSWSELDALPQTIRVGRVFGNEHIKTFSVANEVLFLVFTTDMDQRQ